MSVRRCTLFMSLCIIREPEKLPPGIALVGHFNGTSIESIHPSMKLFGSPQISQLCRAGIADAIWRSDGSMTADADDKFVDENQASDTEAVRPAVANSGSDQRKVGRHRQRHGRAAAPGTTRIEQSAGRM